MIKKIPLYIVSTVDHPFIEANKIPYITLNKKFIHELLDIIAFLYKNRNEIKQNYNQLTDIDKDIFNFKLTYYSEEIRIDICKKSAFYHRLSLFIRYEDLENESILDIETLNKLSPNTITQYDCFILKNSYTINPINGFTS